MPPALPSIPGAASTSPPFSSLLSTVPRSVVGVLQCPCSALIKCYFFDKGHSQCWKNDGYLLHCHARQADYPLQVSDHDYFDCLVPYFFMIMNNDPDDHLLVAIPSSYQLASIVPSSYWWCKRWCKSTVFSHVVKFFILHIVLRLLLLFIATSCGDYREGLIAVED